MKKGKTVKGLLLVSMASMLALAACGKSDNNQSGGSEASPTSGGKDTITLTIMHPWTSPNPDNDVYKARIAQFESDHPNIKIEQDGVAAAQYKTKLFTLAAGNNLADINVVWPGADLDPLVSGDLLLPLNDQMDNWNELVQDDALAGFNKNGNQYAVPTKQNFVDIIYYNKEMFSQVGYDTFPATYEEWIDAIKKLKEAGLTPISLGNKEQWPLQSSYMSTLTQRFAGDDFLQNVLDGKAKFTDEEFVKAVAVIDELTKLKAFNSDANNMDSVQAQDYFIQGKAAMHITSATVNARIRIDNPEGDKFGIALFPSVPGGKGDAKKAAGVPQFGIAIKSGLSAEKQQAALEFMKYFVSEDLYKDLSKAGIMVPTKSNVAGEGVINPFLAELMELTSNGSTRVFDSIIPTQPSKEFENGLQALTIGHGTPEDVAKDTQAALDNLK